MLLFCWDAHPNYGVVLAKGGYKGAYVLKYGNNNMYLFWPTPTI